MVNGRDALLDRARVADALLDCLRQELGDAATYAEEPRRLTGGRDTVVYAFRLEGVSPPFDAPLVARLFAGPHGASRAATESAIQRVVAEAEYPCPRPLLVHEGGTALDAAFVVMELVPGRQALEGALSPSTLLWRLPRLMAEAHVRLHALDVVSVRTELESSGVFRPVGVAALLADISGRVERFALRELEPALEWLERHDPREERLVLCHGDFHPRNLLVDGGRVSGVVDWANVFFAPPACDVGRTSVIHSCAPVGGGRVERAVTGAVRRWLNARYLDAYAQLAPLDPAALGYYEALNALALLAVGREYALAPWESGAGAWAEPAVAADLARLIRRRTGVAVDLPPLPLSAGNGEARRMLREADEEASR